MKIEKFAFIFTVLFVFGTFFFFDAASSPGGGGAKPPTATGSALTNGKVMVFSDDFNGSELNGRNWATCYDWKKPNETGCTNGGNFEQQWYTDTQVAVGNGELTLTAVRQPIAVAVDGKAKEFLFRSGMVNSGAGSIDGKVRWSGLYGYFEARMKVEKGQGVWPAFWLLPVDREWPPEIDVMEFIGSNPGQILQTVHWPDAENRHQKSDFVVKGEEDYSSDWHTYAVDWRPDGIDWYIDGVKTRSFTGANVPSEPMEIVLNLAIGGQLPGNADGSTPMPRKLSVDYVRVFQTHSQLRPKHE